MKRMYPEVYKTVQNNPNVNYLRVFSEPRKNGLRRIKFWGPRLRNTPMADIEELLKELTNQPGVKFAGYNTYSYGRSKGWGIGLPPQFPVGNFIEVWVE